MSKIGIVTWHYYPNVGSMLQAYALSHYLTLLGHTVEFINYREYNRPKLESIRATLCKFDSIIPHKISNILNYHYPHFISSYLPQSHPIYSSQAMNGVAKKYDTVICGSDQIWAPSVFNPIYFLSFVNGDARKISYAASLGLPAIPADKKQAYAELLKDFDAISVREDEGAKLLNDLGIDAEVVCDPTLLLNAGDYDKIFGKIKHLCTDSYVFCYFLGNNPQHRKMAKRVAKLLDKKLVIYSRYADDANYADIYVNFIGPCQFVSYINHSTFVVTDSFHGLAFSLIFRKNFYAVERFEVTDKNNQNSRVYNILRHARLQDRLLREMPQAITAVNYAIAEPSLNSFIERSKVFLQNEII